MKSYIVSVPREFRFYFSVEAEDSREARFEAIRTIVTRAISGLVPLDIGEGHEVYPCEDCASNLPKSDLRQIDGGKLVCLECENYRINGIPNYW
jgi:hypothetical protein